MSEDLKYRIQNLPEYKMLLARRRRLNLPLILVMLASYFGFVLGLAFFKDILSTRIGDGVTTLGIGLGLGLILLTIGVTAVFIYQTDKTDTELLMQIRKKTIGG